MNMLDYNQLHEIYRNTTLYISSIPAGAGGSFLGYLQNYYRDAVPQLTPVEYPTDNFWDSVGGVPCVIQYSDKDTFNDIPLEETYVNEDFQAEGEENSAKILASLNTLHTEIQGNNGPNPDNTVYYTLMYSLMSITLTLSLSKYTVCLGWKQTTTHYYTVVN